MNNILPEELINEIILEKKQSSKAEKLIRYLFKDIYDKSGEPYIQHLYAVAKSFQDEFRYTVGLLHDTIKDTSITINDLAMLGIKESYIEVIILLTRKKDIESYDDYINRIIDSNNISAMQIKISDICNNSKENRLEKLPIEKQKELRTKYAKAKHLILNKLKEL